MLVGREAELERVRAVLAAARGGRAGSLALVGEAGVGKTALLDAAAESADGLRVLRTRGVEAEAELPFAALVELVSPLEPAMERLPEPQAAALRRMLTLSEAKAPRGEVVAATLALLTAATEERPLLLLVDDAHWLDAGSGLALAFSARRGHDLPLAILFATRPEEEARFSLEGIEQVVLEPLAPAEAQLLVLDSHPTLDEATAVRVVGAAAGNPLALLELPKLVTGEGAADALAEPLPAGDAARRLFGRRLERLGPKARLALLTAAAARTGELRLLAPAWEELEVSGTIEEAERSGLVALDGEQLEFRHPLVRSLAYGDAQPDERRRAHAALATAGRTGGAAKRDEATWHAALATIGPDHEIADALGELAERLPPAAAATAYERSARLTPDTRRAAHRLLAAAAAANEAAEFRISARLAAEAKRSLDDAIAGAEAERLIALADVQRHRLLEATDRLVDAASSIAALAPAKAARMLADAVEFCSPPERGIELADRALDLSRDADPLTRLRVGLRRSDAFHYSGRFPEARALALEAAGAAEQDGSAELRSLEGLMLLHEAFFSGADLERAAPLARAAVQEARRVGALDALRLALAGLWSIDMHAGRFLSGLAAAEEELELAQGLGRRFARIEALGHVAWCDAVRGNEQRCRDYVAERFELASLGQADPIVHPALAILELALGRFEEAVTAIEPTIRVREGRKTLSPAEVVLLVEALALAGRTNDAESTLQRFEADSRVRDDALARALAGRCHGLLADRASFETAFETALEDHRREARRPFEEARTLLCYGERLRRERRRLDARRRIGEALDAFRLQGATAWVRRAEAELAATGGRARRRIDSTRDDLTAQELVVARLVAQGLRNKEVAAQLFLSTNTIETHLRHVFRKLGIRSRTELAAKFTDFRDSSAEPAT